MAVLMVNYRGSVGNGDNVQQSILGNIGKVAKISSSQFHVLNHWKFHTCIDVLLQHKRFQK
jgi:hypothetical protein